MLRKLAVGNAGDPPLLGRKPVLMGMLTSGFVIANAAQPSAIAAGTVKPGAIAATQPSSVAKWTPSTAYMRGQQVISPNNDVVAAKAAHMSSVAYANDTVKWTLSPTYERTGLAVDVRRYGSPVTATNVNLAIQTAAAAGACGSVILPSGRIILDAKITLAQGVEVIGAGGHDSTSRPGTELVPAAGYTGVGLHYPASGADLWHHAGLRRIRVSGFASHGIHVEGGMGELTVLDEVMSQANGGDGIRIEGASTPSMLGRLSLHDNKGAGLRLVSQTEGLTQIEYLAGDNNGESLMTIDSADTSTIIQVLAWKAERWGATPGHPNVFVINDGNGSLVDLGSGRVQVGSGVSAGNAIIRQASGGGVARVKVRHSYHNGGGADYAYGYQDVVSGVTYTPSQTQRVSLWIKEPLTAIDPGSTAFALVSVLNGLSIYTGAGTPIGALPAPPGSTYHRSSGQIYIKESGTDASGWAQIPTPSGSPTWTGVHNFTGGVRLPGYTPALRPSASTLGNGAVIYDTTLAKPVFSDGARWRDATGTVV